MRMEKRVVVSCPLRDPAVGSVIARMVALGHHISSESSMLRSAEGRIDTELANPLNLLLGRPVNWFSNALSRVMDVILSFVLIVILSPVLVLVALAIMIETGRPVLYRQRRVGARGRPFDVIKFRSMYPDAEKRSGPVWASQNDPRITKVGRILRRTRLDELPQLFNVFVGQMALVGPRPERPHFFNELRRDVPLFELRTIVRPGITGWAQVRAPYADGPEAARAKLAYDLFYVTRRSPWFDLAILFETVGVAFSGKGSR
jgi:exopolysaccharide biosynthesis polyprenyl glycosylphosphotransferase